MKQNQNFNSLLERLARTKGIRNVFVDLVDAVLYGLIVQDRGNFARNPINEYNEQEQEEFKALMIELGGIMEYDGMGMYDALGDIFMEHLSYGKNGQFFTPQCISDMMALMSVPGAKDGQTVLDCACGSGRMLLAAAKINRHLKFYAADIDLLCVKMTALNLCLNSLRGEVAHMNALSMEHYGSLFIHYCPFTKIPYIITTPAKETSMIERISKTFEQQPEKREEVKQYIQQSLF